ncbi:hypothetical protein CGRA01v4_07406 [Colletotrichum graminicola]|nr:hypothetical protein CGRA01v4_07406 [Colletotrichum graminicola]
MKRLVNYHVGVRGVVRVVHGGPGSISASREEREGPCFADLDGRGRGMAVMEGVRAVLYIRSRARFKLLLLLPVRTVPYLYLSVVRERGQILPKGNHYFPSYVSHPPFVFFLLHSHPSLHSHLLTLIFPEVIVFLFVPTPHPPISPPTLLV